MDRSTKLKLAAGAAGIVMLAIVAGVVGAIAAAQVISSDDEVVEVDRVRERVPLLPDDFGEPRFFADPFPRFPGRGVDLDEAASYLDLPVSEVKERLVEGDTLADIAEDEDKSVEGLVRALVAAESERIDEAAEEAKDELDERLRDLVNGEFAPLGFERERDYFFPRPRR